jgi:hypothetical protein
VNKQSRMKNGSQADCQGCPEEMFVVLYINECEWINSPEWKSGKVKLIVRPVQGICMCCGLINMSEKTVHNEKVEVRLIVRAVQGICFVVIWWIWVKKTVHNEKVEVRLIVRAVQGICFVVVWWIWVNKNSPEWKGGSQADCQGYPEDTGYICVVVWWIWVKKSQFRMKMWKSSWLS